MSGPQKITPEDVLAQFVVVKTKDNQIAVQFPAAPGQEGVLDVVAALELLAAGLNTLANMVKEKVPKEPPRIVPVRAIPKEFLLKGKL